MTIEPELATDLPSDDSGRNGPENRVGHGQTDLDPREKLIAVQVEQRILKVIRRETQDPYAGLPADDVLDRLDRRFPNVHFPERMMGRVEKEQTHRHDVELASAKTAQYVAETERHDATEERNLQKQAGRRAERVLYVLLAIGIVLVFTGHGTTGGVVLGTSLVGIVGAFLTQRFGRGRD